MSQGDINMPPPSELGMNKNKYMHHVYINIDMGKIMIKSAISQQKKLVTLYTKIYRLLNLIRFNQIWLIIIFL